MDTSPLAWTMSEGANAGGGIAKYGFQLSATGSSCTELLGFSISGVADDTISSYAISSTFKPAATEFFAAHIAGFDAIDGEISTQFAGSASVVPVPATLWLFGYLVLVFWVWLL